MSRTLICGVGLDEPEAVLRVAAGLSQALELRLMLVHVARPPRRRGSGRLRYPPAHSLAGLHDEAWAASGKVLDGARMLLGPEVALERVRFGDPARELVAASVEHDAAVLVVGAGGRRRLAVAALGSVSAQTAATAPCPVVTVPPRAYEFSGAAMDGDAPMPSVVCGVDGSLRSLGALRFAAELSARLEVRLVGARVLGRGASHVVASEDLGAVSSRPGVSSARNPAVVASELCRVAVEEAAEFVVVGIRGRRSVRSAVRGSVCLALVARAPVPVAVVNGVA